MTQRTSPESQTPELSQSLTGKRWTFKDVDQRISLTLAQRYNLPEIVARVLMSRAIRLEDVENYLNPTLKQLMPDPSHLLDMDKAIERVIEALEQKQKIAVFGDYDVDGATSSALLRRYFRDIGVEIVVYIPDRLTEGYGPNSPALQKLKDQGTAVVLMVDCGTTAFEPLATAKAIGLDVIVIDHHTSQPTLPEATAIINPNRLDENSPLRHLCAAGLTFLFIVALHRILRQQNWFSNRAEPDIRQYLDLVALGTVCDVMPLTDLNRAFVVQGLKVMRQRGNIGLAVLADIAKINEAPSPYHLGFIVGPRVNAGGRIGQADLGSRLLSTTDSIEAQSIALQLDQYNRERQILETQVMEDALLQINEEGLDHHPVILVAGQNWHPGVIGIVSGRLKERYNRPACVVSFDKEIGKGSGRSIPGIELGAAMHTACQKGLLLAGGGHAMAAGFTVNRDLFPEFRTFLNDHLGKSITETTPILKLDGALSLNGATVELVMALAQLEPYGMGNPTPRFMFANVRIGYAEKVKEDHIRCQVMSQDGLRLKAMAFRVVDTIIGQTLLSIRPPLMNIAGTLKLDSWGGRNNITLIIEDISLCPHEKQD